MAQLNDSIVSGNLRVTDEILTDTLQATKIKVPTTSGGATYDVGSNGQVIKSNGTSVYWSDDSGVTGSGTSGQLTKWNGTNTLTSTAYNEVTIPNVTSAGSMTTVSVTGTTLNIINGSAPTLGTSIKANKLT